MDGMKKISKKVKIGTLAALSALLLGTVSSKVAASMNVTYDDVEHSAMDTNSIILYEDADGNGKISKGDLLRIEDVDVNNDEESDFFRVMKTEGKYLTLCAMENSMSTTSLKPEVSDFDGEYGISYAKSMIMNYCNSYYNAMPETLKKAVVIQNIEQSMYRISYEETQSQELIELSAGNYFQTYTDEQALEVKKNAKDLKIRLTETAKITVGDYPVYVPSVEDILEYYEDQETPYPFYETFMLSENDISLIAVRGAVSGYADRVICLNTVTGNFADFRSNYPLLIFPTFTVEIS